MRDLLTFPFDLEERPFRRVVTNHVRRVNVSASRNPSDEAVLSDEPESSVPAAGASGEGMDINQAVREVLKVSLAHDGLRRGLKEVLKTIEFGEAQLCILAQVRQHHHYAG